MSEAPRLTASSVLYVSREGGLAHFPGLAQPRCIRCTEHSETQRLALQYLLGSLAELADLYREKPRSTGADQRCFRLWVMEGGDEAPHWSLQLDECQAPDALTTLWQQGESYSTDE